ncbi:MAG: hypothetical protein AVDCRST_MAG78-354, partial [uncultured Rubrobacteraceae bacterium]
GGDEGQDPQGLGRHSQRRPLLYDRLAPHLRRRQARDPARSRRARSRREDRDPEERPLGQAALQAQV